MHRQSLARRIGSEALRVGALAWILVAASLDAHAQSGAIYRCAANDYTNTLTEQEAVSRHCAKIGNAEWVFSGSDAAGRQYTYNDRRTVVRDDGTVETWLQVALPRRFDVNAADGDAATHVRTVSPHVIRCGQRTVTAGATYFLDMRDNSVTKDSSMRAALFPPPERVAETLVRRLCVERTRTSVALRSF